MADAGPYLFLSACAAAIKSYVGSIERRNFVIVGGIVAYVLRR